MAVDPNEAPEGYDAYEFLGEKSYDCFDCDFMRDECSKLKVSCVSTKRNDGKSVIFMKRN